MKKIKNRSRGTEPAAIIWLLSPVSPLLIFPSPLYDSPSSTISPASPFPPPLPLVSSLPHPGAMNSSPECVCKDVAPSRSSAPSNPVSGPGAAPLVSSRTHPEPLHPHHSEVRGSVLRDSLLSQAAAPLSLGCRRLPCAFVLSTKLASILCRESV